MIAGENLCTYEHPKFVCGGRESRSNRRKCKFFPVTMEDCPEFDRHGCGDCDCASAQFESWFMNQKPE